MPAAHTLDHRKTRAFTAVLAPALIAAACAFGLTGCEDSETTALDRAQACLNTATPSTASTCTAMVQGIESSKAYAIRCSVHYLVNDFTSTRFATAYQQIKASSGSTDPMTAGMAYLVFPDTAGAHGSDQLQTDCNRSGLKSLIRISLLTATATFIRKNTGLSITDGTAALTPDQMKQAIAQFNGTPSTLGTLAIQANTAFCSEGSSLSGNKICTSLNSAVAAGGTSLDATAIGNQLKSLLQM